MKINWAHLLLPAVQQEVRGQSRLLHHALRLELVVVAWIVIN